MDNQQKLDIAAKVTTLISEAENLEERGMRASEDTDRIRFFTEANNKRLRSIAIMQAVIAL